MSDPTLPPEQPEQPEQPYVPPAVPGGDYGPPPPAPPPPPPPPPAPPAYGAPPPPPPGYAAPPSPGFAPPPPASYGQDLSAGDRPFSVSDAFNWGWAKFQQNTGAIVISTLIYFVILAIIEVVAYIIFGGLLLSTTALHVDPNTGQLSGGASTGFVTLLLFAGLSVLVFTLLFALVQSAIIHGLLQIANGKKVEIGDFFKFEKVGQVLTAGLVVAVATAIGAFLCYIPALIVAFFTPFYLFFIVDKNLAPMDAIKASISLVNKNLASMFILFLAMIVAYIVGAIVCLVGLIVTMPVALLALTFAYRKFQNEPVAA